MSSSDRESGNDSGRKSPAGAPSEAAEPEPIERSPRGRVIIRSSSHPPVGERGGDARDVSGARALPASDRAPAGAEDRDEGAEARSKRSTPAERPRRRRKVQAERAARAQHFAPSRRNTPDRSASAHAEQGADHAEAAARSRAQRVRKITLGIAIVIAILIGTALWALRH